MQKIKQLGKCRIGLGTFRKDRLHRIRRPKTGGLVNEDFASTKESAAVAACQVEWNVPSALKELRAGHSRPHPKELPVAGGNS
jgi:hypothetical protein